MPRNIWQEVAEWRGANHLQNSDAIQGPGNRRTLVWETTAGNGVAVIRKIGDQHRGQFVDFEIVDKPFKSVVATIKRKRTIERKRLEKEGLLC